MACSSQGGSRYSCGVPEGQTCLSAMQVYAMTEPGSDWRNAPDRDAGTETTTFPVRPDPVQIEQTGNGELVLGIHESRFEPTQSMVSKPQREPARVMRIWIAPWQDAAGDLIGGAHLFTEISPARWRHAAPVLTRPLILSRAEGTPLDPEDGTDQDDNRGPRDTSRQPVDTGPPPADGPLMNPRLEPGARSAP